VLQTDILKTMREAKDPGRVDMQACFVSMDLLRLESGDRDSLVDGVEGVTASHLNAGNGQVVFIEPARRHTEWSPPR
jgi:peroxiredoxin family protein